MTLNEAKVAIKEAVSNPCVVQAGTLRYYLKAICIYLAAQMEGEDDGEGDEGGA